MAGIDTLMKNVSSHKVKIEKDLESLFKDYRELHETLKGKFREELNYSGSLEGLGSFSALNNAVSKNLNSVRNAHYLFKKLKDLSVFDVSEIEEDIINEDLSKLMK
jgi:hypothetical protein